MSDMPMAGIYTDFQGTMKLSAQAKNDPQGALKEASQQFEGILLQMMLKEMRKTHFDDNKYFNSYETEFWRTLLDQQVAINLSEKEPLGIAGQVRQQLDPTAMYRSMYHPISREAPLSVRKNFLPSAPLQSFSDRQSFIKSMLPHAQKAAQVLGVEPQVLIAQAALETGWGKHFAAPYNLFGIKADQRWHGPKSTQETVEFTGAMPMVEQADFRAYHSFEESFLDYARFLRENPRYEKALANVTHNDAFVDALAEAGYATDPQYATKIKAILDDVLTNGDFALDEHSQAPITS